MRDSLSSAAVGLKLLARKLSTICLSRSICRSLSLSPSVRNSPQSTLEYKYAKSPRESAITKTKKLNPNSLVSLSRSLLLGTLAVPPPREQNLAFIRDPHGLPAVRSKSCANSFLLVGVPKGDVILVEATEVGFQTKAPEWRQNYLKHVSFLPVFPLWYIHHSHIKTRHRRNVLYILLSLLLLHLFAGRSVRTSAHGRRSAWRFCLTTLLPRQHLLDAFDDDDDLVLIATVVAVFVCSASPKRAPRWDGLVGATCVRPWPPIRIVSGSGEAAITASPTVDECRPNPYCLWPHCIFYNR